MVDQLPTTALVGPGDPGASPLVKPRLRGVSHHAAALVFPLLGVAAVLAARSAGDRVAVAVYAAGVTGMYTTSACYHRGQWTAPAKRRMRRLDHSMILVAIASTYTPVAVVGLSPGTAWALLSVVWGLALAGVVVRNLWLEAPRWVTASVYIGVGWAAVAVTPALWAQLGVVVFVLLITGGLVYSAGAAVYSLHRPDPWPAVFGYHEVFHALVIVAGLVFYAAVLAVVLRA
jgi:hemolysin III